MLGNAVKFTESGCIRLSSIFSLIVSDPQAYIVTTEFGTLVLGFLIVLSIPSSHLLRDLPIL